MAISIPKLRAYLNDFDFRKLFIEGLNWQHYRQQVPAFPAQDGNTYRFTPVAEQGGMVVLECLSSDGTLPPKNVRDKIEKHITALAHEHILIFVNDSRSTSLWQWVKRGQGAAKTRTHTVHKGQLADALLQKLAGIAFTLGELDEDGRALISTVTEKVEDAFNRKNVTKKFYDEFKRKHDNFRAFLTGIQERSEQDWYTSVMLNRLMFLYFVQSKGFLDRDPDYLRHKLEQTKGNYYRDFLTILFFKGLAQEEGERTADVNRLLGKVPYLNGGLFLEHQIEETYKDKIQIDNRAFEGLYDFFKEWQWHLDDRELHGGNEINPDVLGYIFEKYINQKQMGAYYTQEDITNYICKNTILPFLLEKTGVKVQELLPEIEAYIYPAVKQAEYLPTETEREYNARQTRYQQILEDYKAGKIATINDLITYNLDIETIVEDWLRRLNNHVTLNSFYFDGLKKLTVLDPTCGSGAFLFAAMNILEPLYDIALERMTHFTHAVNHDHFIKELKRVRKHANLTYFVLKSIIIHNLYGVDIMDEAVEICKLRLFLKLIAQIEEFDDIEPLPDIDFNIRAGNTLVGFATEREIFGRLFATDELKQKVKGVDRSLENFRNLQTQDDVPAEQLRGGKKDIQSQLDTIRTELDTALMQEYGRHDLKVFRDSHKPFHWYVEFNNVMKEDEGFDVIVGNPPYVEYAKVRAEYGIGGFSTEKAGNLYAFVVEQSKELINEMGRFGMIVPMSIVSTERMSPLRTLLFESSSDLFISNFSGDAHPSVLFDGVKMRLTIVLAKVTKTHSNLKIYSTGFQRWFAEFRPHLFSILTYQYVSMDLLLNSLVPKIGNKVEAKILKKIYTQKRKFGFNVIPNGTHSLFAHRIVAHFIKAFDFAPYFWNEKDGLKKSEDYKVFSFNTDLELTIAGAVLNSSTFYIFYLMYSDAYHCGRELILDFPFDFTQISKDVSISLSSLVPKLMINMVSNAKRRRIEYRTGWIEYDEFYPRLSKSIIDEIDRVLAQHYGFTDEELDFIINYDIKYRMGKEGEGEE